MRDREGWPVPSNREIFPKEPSAEILELGTEIPDLFDAPRLHAKGEEKNPIALQAAFPLNLAGAVFLEVDHRIEPGYTELHRLDVPDGHTLIYPNIIVHVGGKNIEGAVLTTDIFGEPLMNSGVVLSGPYAGIIWEGAVVRVFPDRRLDYRLPEIPPALTSSESQNRFMDRFREYMARHKDAGVSHISGLFYNLVEALGIRVDEEAFHLTRSVKEYGEED